MVMLITVCEGEINTEIINGLDIAKKTMYDAITQIFTDAGKLDIMEEDKGDEWNVFEMSGYVGYDINGASYDYQIVELPSYITELI